jgi:hypothetical protein
VELNKLQQLPALPESVDQISKLRRDILKLFREIRETGKRGRGLLVSLEAAFSSLFRKRSEAIAREGTFD